MTITITTTIIADINGNVIGVSLASDNLWILCAIDHSPQTHSSGDVPKEDIRDSLK